MIHIARNVDTIVESHLTDDEAEKAKNVYLGSTEQADTYDEPVPEYARLLTDLIGSMQPSNVLSSVAMLGATSSCCYTVCRMQG